MPMMAPSPRERGRRGHRLCEEEFVLYLQGIPAHCRWQELKDFVRQTALHIRQAVVYDDQHGYPTGLGQIIVKNEEEAWRTFHKLSANGWDGQPLTVTLARATSPTRPIAGPTQSSTAVTGVVYGGGKLARQSMSAATTGAPESPIVSESLRAHSLPSATLYPPYIPASSYTPTSHGHIQTLPAPMDQGYHSPAWHSAPEVVAFSPTMTVFSSTVDQIEYPYYVPYSHAMHVLVPQPMYAEANYHEFQQHSPSFYSRPSTSTSASSNAFYQQSYHAGNYDSRKNSSSTGTPNVYPTTTPEAYGNTGVHTQRTMSIPSTRHIIIDNIRPGIDLQALKAHFHDAGSILSCQIIRYNSNENGTHYNEHSYPGQCYATATFSTPEEAEKAVQMYNGSDVAGSRVVVRLDPEGDANMEDSTNAAAAGSDVGGESDWVGPHSYSSSYTTSSTGPSSMGTFSNYPESPNSQLSATTGRTHYRHNRNRRDSGKELLKSSSYQPARSEYAEEDDYKVNSPSSRSVSPKSSGSSEKSRSMQPLVVNGSLAGRAKM